MAKVMIEAAINGNAPTQARIRIIAVQARGDRQRRDRDLAAPAPR